MHAVQFPRTSDTPSPFGCPGPSSSAPCSQFFFCLFVQFFLSRSSSFSSLCSFLFFIFEAHAYRAVGCHRFRRHAAPHTAQSRENASGVHSCTVMRRGLRRAALTDRDLGISQESQGPSGTKLSASLHTMILRRNFRSLIVKREARNESEVPRLNTCKQVTFRVARLLFVFRRPMEAAQTKQCRCCKISQIISRPRSLLGSVTYTTNRKRAEKEQNTKRNGTHAVKQP